MMKKQLLRVLSTIVITSVAIGISPTYSGKIVQAIENEERATGAIKPTEEQQKWFDENSTKVADVRYNTLAESRINKENKAKAAPMSQGVAIGEEIVKKGEESKAKAATNDVILDSVDNSELSCFPTIGNQGGLGSCAAFSTTYYQMTHMVGLKNNWDNKNTNLNTKFSPKWTYNMINGGEDRGCWPSANIKTFMEVGAATWSDFPYEKSASNPKNYREWATDSKVWKNAQKYKVKEFGDIVFANSSDNTPITDAKDTDLNQIKKLLTDGYVLNYLTHVYGDSSSKVKDNPNTKNDDDYVGEYIVTSGGNAGYHSMTVVGYNDDIWVDINNNGKIDDGELGAFKVVNSWGESYGNKGFAWFAYDSLNKVSSVKEAPVNPNRTESFEDYKVTYFNTQEIKQPKLAVEFTANHALRDQISIQISAKDTANNKEISYTDFTQALHNAGGAYAFDGTNTAVDGEFSLDFDKIISAPEFDAKSFDKWFIKFKDNNKDGKPLEIKDIKLIDDNGNVYAVPNEGASKSIDGNEQVFSFDYKIGGLKKPTLRCEEVIPGRVEVHYDATQPERRKGYYYLYENGVCVKSNKGGQPGFGSSLYAGALNDGLYEYKVVAEDDEGNRSESDTVKVQIKNLIDPVLTVKELGTPYDGDFVLSLKAKQPTDKEMVYKLYENDVMIRSNSGADFLKGDRDFDIRNLKDGVYEYRIEIYDKQGNKAESETVKVITAKNATDWKIGTNYKLKDQIVYEGSIYECTYEHKSQAGWEPGPESPALWKKLY